MQRHRIVFVNGCRLRELFRDLGFRLTENDARLALALGLGLARHGVFEARRNAHVPDLDRLNGDSPRICFLIEDALQLAAQRFAIRDHLRELMPADRLPQRCLRAQQNCLLEIGDLQNRLFGVPDHPEDDRVDVGWDRVSGERGFGAHTGDADPLVHVPAESIDDRDDMESPWPPEARESAEAQYGYFLPLIGNLDSEEKINANRRRDE